MSVALTSRQIIFDTLLQVRIHRVCVDVSSMIWRSASCASLVKPSASSKLMILNDELIPLLC